MHNSKCIYTPIEKVYTLSLKHCPKSDEEKKEIARVSYSNAIESLMYIMLCTWLDICFTIELVSRYQNSLGPIHWQTIKKIFHYLWGIVGHDLNYQGRDMRLKGYSDANWASDKNECKSTIGYTFILCGGTIFWYSKK